MPALTILFFGIIAAMRVVQKICMKRTSNLLNSGVSFFHYGAFYQLASALFAFVLLCFIGFNGANSATVLCAFVSALLFVLELFTSLEAIKGSTLTICNMVATGGLFVPCIAGIFLFNEPMRALQWVGMGVFVVAVYFLASGSKETYKKFSFKTFLMLLLNFLANGAVMVVQKYFAVLVQDGNVALYSTLTFAFGAVILYICMFALALLKQTNEQGERINQIKPLSKSLYLYGILLAVALCSINQLVTTMAKTVPSVVLFTVSSALSIIITSIVGAVAFHEKLTVKNVIGILLGLGAIVMINVF